MDWIECNLPWEQTSDQEDEIYKSLMKQASKIENKLNKEVELKLNVDFDELDKEKSNLVRCIYDVCEEYSKLNSVSVPEAREILGKTLPEVARYNELKLKEDEYYDLFFASEKYNEMNSLKTKAMDYLNTRSFCGNNLNNPGTLIEMLIDDEIKQFLIGNINTSAGVCNDCTAFDSGTIVKRYKVIWQSNGNSNS